jgi:hypothetical protein
MNAKERKETCSEVIMKKRMRRFLDIVLPGGSQSILLPEEVSETPFHKAVAVIIVGRDSQLPMFTGISHDHVGKN